MKKMFASIINCVIALYVFQFGLNNNPDEQLKMLLLSVVMFATLQTIVYIPELKKNITKYFDEES